MVQAWLPLQDMRDHSRERCAAGVFFYPPPPEIGAIHSAESNLEPDGRTGPVWRRLAVAAGFSLPGIFVIVLSFAQGSTASERTFCVPLGIILIIAACLLVWLFGDPLPTCSYVGEDGAAIYIRKRRGEGLREAKVLQFADATELRTKIVNRFIKGAYTGSAYDFVWIDAAGATRLAQKGSYYSQTGKPRRGNTFHFARAAELAWSTFLLHRADAALGEKGYLEFNINSGKSVRIGPGWIEFAFSNRTDRCEAHEIRAIMLLRGIFTITHMDAHWYSSRGKFSFQYGNMANARLFILALERFMPQNILPKNLHWA